LAQGVFEENDPNLKWNKKIVAFGCAFLVACCASFLLSYYSLLMNELLLNFTNENLKYSFKTLFVNPKMCPPSPILDNFNP
jgi:hypothetical protein